MGQDARDHIDVAGGKGGQPPRMIPLPAPDIKRWVPQRKADIVSAVRHGQLSLDEACSRYALTVEEFLSWENAITQYGLRGLRISDIQHHRHS
jgi:hypothetical protein